MPIGTVKRYLKKRRTRKAAERKREAAARKKKREAKRKKNVNQKRVNRTVRSRSLAAALDAIDNPGGAKRKKRKK